MKGIIYKATDNWTGKVYIGQTMTTLGNRRGEHLKDAEKGNDWNAFHLALFQRGGDFTWEVIDEFEGDKEFLIHALNVAEEYHILKYDSTNKDKGYNSVYGGYSADKHAAHIKAKLRTSYQAKAFLQYDLDGNFLREFASVRAVASFLNCDHINGSQIDTRRGHKWRGYQWRSKIGMRTIHQKIEPYEPKIQAGVRTALYDIKGDFVKVFERYADVEKELGYSPILRDDFSKEVVISDSRKGDFLCYRIPDGGYPQKVNTRIIEKHQPKPSQLVVCDCYDLDGKFVARYPSLIDAKRHTGVDVGTIRDWCKRVEPLKITGNTRMLWRYGKGEIRPQIEVIPFIRKEEYREKKEHRVLQYSLKGEYIATFNRIQEAADASGDSYCSIRKQCQGGKVRETNFQWRYYSDGYPLEIPKFAPIPKSLKVGRPRKSTYSPGQQTLF